MGENQEKKPPAPPPRPLTKIELMERRRLGLEQLMVEKEALQMGHVLHKFPTAYYTNWKREANDTFALLVTYTHRIREQKRRNRGG